MWLKAHTVYAQWCRERERARERGAAPVDGELPERTPGSGEASVDARVDAEKILRAVQEKLGDESYEILVLSYEGGLTQVEVAEALGRDRKTVATRLREARAFAARLLGEDGGRA